MTEGAAIGPGCGGRARATTAPMVQQVAATGIRATTLRATWGFIPGLAGGDLGFMAAGGMDPEVSGASYLRCAQGGEYLILVDRSELMFGRKRQEIFFLAECFRPECRPIAIGRQASPAKMELKEIFQLFPAGMFKVVL